MLQRSLVASIGVSASIVAFGAFVGMANAQTTLGGCNLATGLGPNGNPCVELTPLDNDRISSGPAGASGAEQLPVLDTTTLGQTYACRQVDARSGAGGGGALLFEDCGTPLTGSELGQLTPYYGTTGAPAPVAYAPPPPPPPPVAVAPPPPPPVVAAPVVAVPAAGLGNAGLIAAGIGAAALVGLAIVALDDDDDDSSSTTTTN